MMTDSKTKTVVLFHNNKQDGVQLFSEIFANQLIYLLDESKLCQDVSSVCKGNKQSWQDFLPEDLLKQWHSYVASENHTISLILSRDLPKQWIDYPWEFLWLLGQPTWGKIIVIRDRLFDGDYLFEPCVITANGSVFLNLFPTDELPEKLSIAEKLDAESVDINIVNAKVAKSYAQKNDISRLSSLIIFAHGSEEEGAKPFYLVNGAKREPWELADVALAPLIIILACANEQGNMASYSRKLLKNGAKTVISAIGKIDAQQALDFMALFAQAFCSGKSVAQSLAGVQQQSEQVNGARRLRIYGRGDLCLQSEQHLLFSYKSQQTLLEGLSHDDYLTDDAAKCLNEMVSRTIWQQIICGRAWYELLESSLKEMALIIDNSRSFLERANYAINQASPLVKAFLLPFLITLAEKYDHPLMEKLEPQYQDEKHRYPSLAGGLYYASSYAYRKGNYSLFIKQFFQAQSCYDFSDYKSHFYRKILSIMVDLMLLDGGNIYFNDLELMFAADTNCEKELWKARDVMSRFALRKAACEQAKSYMKIKQRSAEKNHSQREQSWLLYIATFCAQDEQDLCHSLEAQVLPEISKIDYQNWQGNSDLAYQIRALSFYYCRTEQKDKAQKLLADFIPLVEYLIKDDKLRDYAPIGFSLVFLELSTKEAFFSDKKLKGIWASIAVYMADHHYYAELMGLYALLNDKEKALKAMRKFHIFRKRCVEAFLSSSQYHEPEIKSEYLLREEKEQQTIANLDSKLSIRIQQLIDSHIMVQ